MNNSRSIQLQQLYNCWKNRTIQNVKWKMSGDMPERMDWLRERFHGIDSIVEFGPCCGCSTIVWMACVQKKLTIVDINKPKFDINLYKDIANELGVVFEY